MASHLGQFVRQFAVCMAFALMAGAALAAPYAALVMDARTGEVLYAKNADTRLHPASLTKMMTLYVTFEAIERGEISLDTMVTVSRNAAAEPPSELGLKAGQKIALRYLIRAAAVKSANDAATAIGEAVGGSEEAFAARMTRTAKAIGMHDSTFRNAHGLTTAGHLSTARDMTILGRRLFFDFPQYYNIFSRRSTDAGVATVASTNRRFLDSYRGADGIKTGYTNAAGFNLTASAERGSKRIIATVLGGQSTAHRNAKMAELLDLGFGSAPANAPVQKPGAPDYSGAAVASLEEGTGDGVASGKTIRVVMAVTSSPRPKARPGNAAAAAEIVTAMQAGIDDAVAMATEVPPFEVVEAEDLAVAEATAGVPAEATPFQVVTEEAAPAEVAVAEAPAETPPFEVVPEDAAPVGIAVAEAPAEAPPFEVVNEESAEVTVAAADAPAADTAPMADPVADTTSPATNIVALSASPVPVRRPEFTSSTDAEPASAPVALASVAPMMIPAPQAPAEAEVVTRLSTSGGRHWGINLGRFPSRSAAERALMKTGLSESAALQNSLRKVVERSGGYDANFMGLSQEQADLACRRLLARAVECLAIGP